MVGKAIGAFNECVKRLRARPATAKSDTAFVGRDDDCRLSWLALIMQENGMQSYSQLVVVHRYFSGRLVLYPTGKKGIGRRDHVEDVRI